MTKEHPDLYKKVIKGGVWVVIIKIITQTLSFLRLIILARLLSKSDFGLVGVALLLIGILETFTDTGFQSALIQHKKDIKPYLNTAWTTNIFRGLLIYLLIYIIAPFAAEVKIPPAQAAQAVNIIRVFGLCVIISSFSNIGSVYFQKELDFKKTFIQNSISNIIGIGLSIIVALIYASPWALVVGKLTNSIVSVFFSYKLHEFRPKPIFDKDKFLELWRYGRWMTQTSILSFIILHGDDIFVWMMLGITDLAYYQMAYKLATTVTYEIVSVVTTVAFPAFSKVSNDIVRLKQAYSKISKLLVAINTVLLLILILFSKQIVLVVLGAKWLVIVPVVQILSFRCIANSFGAIRGPLWQSLGIPSLIAKFQYVRVLFLAIIIYPLTKLYGIAGTATAISIVSIVMQLPESIVTFRILKNPPNDR